MDKTKLGKNDTNFIWQNYDEHNNLSFTVIYQSQLFVAEWGIRLV